jgi:hypothetical protein
MKFLISTILFLFIYFGSIAQDYPRWQTVFEKSYELEKNGQYQESLEILKEYYAADSYDFNIRYGWLYYNLGD